MLALRTRLPELAVDLEPALRLEPVSCVLLALLAPPPLVLLLRPRPVEADEAARFRLVPEVLWLRPVLLDLAALAERPREALRPRPLPLPPPVLDLDCDRPRPVLEERLAERPRSEPSLCEPVASDSGGTLSPFLRALLMPMAMAWARDLTGWPEPLMALPCL